MPDFSLEQNLSHGLIAGVDEVGYGAWAGPVVVAAVVFHTYDLPPFLRHNIHDSKSLSPALREDLYGVFTSSPQWGIWAVGEVSVEAIASGNVLRETLKAMADLVRGMDVQGVLVDGCHRLPCSLPQRSIPKGDQKSLSIAMASIIAKVTRDRLMTQLAQHYPVFGWERNKGYGTAFHQQALRLHGLTPLHRSTYCRRLGLDSL